MFSKVQKEPWIVDEVLDRHPAHDRDDQAGNAAYGDMGSIGIRSMTPSALPDHPDEQPGEGEALQLSEQELLRCEILTANSKQYCKNNWKCRCFMGAGYVRTMIREMPSA